MRAKVARFRGSKQSLVELLFFDSSNSPSDPAKAFDVIKMNIKIIFKNLIICYELYSVYASKVNQDLVLKMT